MLPGDHHSLLMSHSLAQFIVGPTVKILNAPAYERARAAGLSDDEIRAIAKESNVFFAGYAAQKMGYAHPLQQFMADPGAAALDAHSYEKASSAGFTHEQIKSIADRSGLSLPAETTERAGAPVHV